MLELKIRFDGPCGCRIADAIEYSPTTIYHHFEDKDDLVNAGARWVDEPAFRDGTLVWGRVVDDIPDFEREMVALFAEHHAAVAARARGPLAIGRSVAAR